MNDGLMEELLRENEGTSLDFKSAQYAFSGATDEQKSELLKDVLALTNAWRRSDAYILIGVRAVQGGRHVPIGTEDHFDDAQLQQFINGKTNRKVELSYEVYAFEGKKIGVIRIPKQRRPVHAVRGFGKVERNVVYYRLGSSTAIATPDDIASMGATDSSEAVSSPTLDVELGDPGTRRIYGPASNFSSVFHEPISPSVYPDYGTNGPRWLNSLEPDNKDYWRQLAYYLTTNRLVRPIGFTATNRSSNLAQNVRFESFLDLSKGIVAMPDDRLPTRPVARGYFCTIPGITFDANRRGLTVARHGGHDTITVRFGNVQPKSSVWCEDLLYVGTASSGKVDLEGTIYADNLPEPQKVVLEFNFTIETRPGLTIDDLEREDGEHQEQLLKEYGH